MESETELKYINVNLVCPDCNVIMEYEGQDLQTKSNNIYRCSRCKSTVKSEKRYPYLKYVPKK